MTIYNILYVSEEGKDDFGLPFFVHYFDSAVFSRTQLSWDIEKATINFMCK